MWQQTYNPLQSQALSTLVAALPLVVMMAMIFLRRKAHHAALTALTLAVGIATLVFGFPFPMAAASALYGAAFGFLPIGWLILNMIFLYKLTEKSGLFNVVQESITGITADKRLQLLLVAFCFGAFFEGAAGFGAPVAVTSAMLIGLGFPAIQAAGLALLANTAPVAFGSLGTPIVALQGVTGLPMMDLSAMVGRQLPFFSMLVPFWLVWMYAGFGAVRELFPAIFIAGISFAVPQFLVANYHGPWLVDIVASLVSIAAVTLFLKVWKPASQQEKSNTEQPKTTNQKPPTKNYYQAWEPWIILTLTVFLWGIPQVKGFLDAWTAVKIEVPYLHKAVERVPPVVLKPTLENAVFTLNWLSTAGTGILLAALFAGRRMGYSVRGLWQEYKATFHLVKLSLLTISTILALGMVLRYAGLDAALGLAFAQTGWWYPLFGTILGWLGVMITGSDTSANVLFGSLQRITAEQLGLSAVLMAAANSSGGVMGKMVNIQSIVVAGAATGNEGQESATLRYVFWHSIALALLMGLLVMLQAYIPPFSGMVLGK
ncbi:MAG: L-lactate permease [Candidatus Kapabacteria bacterium]|nr:L-lactate permease [Candidatus Kapabacteria bacterium]